MKKHLLLLTAILLAFFTPSIVKAQTFHFQEGFELNTQPAGWLTTNVTWSTTHNNGLYPGTYSVKLKPNESFLMIKALNTADILQFYVKVRDTAAASDFHLYIEKSYNKVEWTEIGKDPCNMENDSIFQLVNLTVNDPATELYIRFRAASINGTNVLGLCYIDDVSVTKLAVAPNDATLTDLSYNGLTVEGFTASNLTYNVEVPYHVEQITMAGVANNPSATLSITNPTNLRGYEADRTGTVQVTSQDGTVVKSYKIVFTVSDYIFKVGFTTTGDGVMPLPGWSGGYTYTSITIPMGNHDKFPGPAAMKFMRGQPDKIGYLITAKYVKVDTLTFYLAVDQPDGVENLLVEKKVLGGVNIMLGNIASSDMTGEWQKFSYFIGETDSTQIVFTPTLTAEGLTRIWIDDLSLKGKKVSGLAIPENSKETNFSIYPNPASDLLNVEFPDNSYSNLTINDLTGRIILTKETHQPFVTLDINNLQKGIYIIKINGPHKSLTRKFIKN
jgi:hypothetical protein